MKLPNLKNLLTGGASGLIDSVKGVISEFHLSPKDQEKAELEITKAINEHSEKMAELSQKELEAHLADMADARNREIQIATNKKTSWITRNTTALLALTFVGVTLLLYILSVIKAVEIHENILRDLRDIVILIMGYYFGSSVGSKIKQNIIEKMSK